MSGYDGTYKSQFDAGLYWNSGSQTPNSIAVPEVSAENSILVPFYLDNGQLMLQPSNTPNGNSEFSAISAKYEVPILSTITAITFTVSKTARRRRLKG